MIRRMILPDNTPGLKEATKRNHELMKKGIWPEPLPIPSVITSDDDLLFDISPADGGVPESDVVPE
jgi:hypothetical protein